MEKSKRPDISFMFGEIPMFTDCRIEPGFISINQFGQGTHTCSEDDPCSARLYEAYDD